MSKRGRIENSTVAGNSPSPKRKQSPSPRRRLSTGRIHENFEKHKSPSRHYSTDGNFANNAEYLLVKIIPL